MSTIIPTKFCMLIFLGRSIWGTVTFTQSLISGWKEEQEVAAWLILVACCSIPSLTRCLIWKIKRKKNKYFFPEWIKLFKKQNISFIHTLIKFFKRWSVIVATSSSFSSLSSSSSSSCSSDSSLRCRSPSHSCITSSPSLGFWWWLSCCCCNWIASCNQLPYEKKIIVYYSV